MASASLQDMWVVYFDPEDAPGQVIVRKWSWDGVKYVDTDECFMMTTQDDVSQWTHEEFLQWRLENARNEIRRRMPGAVMIPRSEGDEPQIVEVWI